MLDVDATDHSASGFTLIEVIVSFLVLAMVLGAATLSISYSARVYRKADEIDAAGLLAQTLIAEKFDNRPTQIAHETGTNGAIHWTISRRTLVSDYTINGGRLMSFDLDVLDKRGHSLGRYRSFYVEHQP